jgi:septum formation protein
MGKDIVKNNHILYIASSSKPRARLLELAHIPFKALKHDSDECVARADLSFADYVLHIAREKMRHVVLPSRDEVGTPDLFLLTADTLVRTMKTNHVLGKPEDMADARRMLALTRSEPIEVVTACRLERRVWEDGAWQQRQVREWCTRAEAEFCVDKDMEDEYFRRIPLALHCSSAGHLEDFGQVFLKSLIGSYSAAQGLPLYELRAELKVLGFFD